MIPASPSSQTFASNAPARRRLPLARWLSGVIAAALVFAAVAYPWLSDALPPVHGPLALAVEFERGSAGDNEPLLTTGVFGDGDFLTVKYVDAETAALGYDSWGSGGPTSATFPLRVGQRQRLDIDLPSLADPRTAPKGDTRMLTVKLDGRELLRTPVHFHLRGPEAVYVAVNPIGGTPAASFRGRITTLSGERLRGRPAALFSAGQRLSWLFVDRPGHTAAVLLLTLAAGFLAMLLPVERGLERLRTARTRAVTPSRRPPHLTAAVVGLASVLLFTALVTGGTFRLLYPDAFGRFFDEQAISLLHGHLDVPESALSGEAFVVDGKYYGYFGITPALLRMPFVVTHLATYELTRSYLVCYFAACLAAAYALLCWSVRRLCGPDAWPSRWSVAVLLGCSGVGSTLFFLGSRAYVYHEAILCGAAFALWSVYFGLRYAEEPARRWWIGAALCGTLAVQARPPAGLFSLFLLGCVSLYHLTRGSAGGSPADSSLAPGSAGGSPADASDSGRGFTPRLLPRLTPPATRHLVIGLIATLGFLSFNGMSYLKFRTFDGSPLRYSVQYSPERLAKFDGKNFHAVNLRHNVHTYVLDPDFRFARHFPFFRFGSEGPHPTFPEAKLDLTESALAFPYAMPGLFALALLGSAWALASAPPLRRPLLLLWVAIGPMALALFTAVVTSHRYTGDFCAFFIAAGACGLAAFDGEPTRWRRVVLGVASALAAFSLFATGSLAFQFQSKMVWGVPDDQLHNDQAIREKVDGLLGIKH